MAYSSWKIGLHIQPEEIKAVAVRLRRTRGWQLCQWWRWPGGGNLLQTLEQWRKEVPARHDLRIGFSTTRTVQRQIPRPLTLREADCERYVASATAQQIQMPAEMLCCDYHSTDNQLNVTAAHQQEVAALCADTAKLRLRLTAITPEACALTSFFRWLPSTVQGICFCAAQHWQWATREQWGALDLPQDDSLQTLSQRLNLAATQWVCCGISPTHQHYFDPWRVLNSPGETLPDNPDSFAIALGLALGSYH